MREIKFRAWDTRIKKMGRVHHLSWDIDETVWVNPDGGYEVAGLFGNNNIVLMQFTGILDKNGKEIYEGDILNYSEMILSENDLQKETQRAGAVYISQRHGVVEWDEEGADFQINMGDIIRGFGARGDWNYEVVGNIYENPELLK